MSKPNINLEELLKEGIISKENADDIRQYYQSKNEGSSNRLFLVFGLLGAVLVGLGIILIIANNWDSFSKVTKTVLAFVPLVIGQGFCTYSLLKMPDNKTWREAASSFTFFAVGAGIALISQIYHIQGSTAEFLLTWMLLTLPLVYVMNSSMTSLLYILGVSYYATELGYFDYPTKEPYLYWLMILAIMPFIVRLQSRLPSSNFVRFHHLFLGLSLTLVLGAFTQSDTKLVFLNYLGLFSLFYLHGHLYRDVGSAFYRMFGGLGAIVLLVVLSFNDFWNFLLNRSVNWVESPSEPEFWILLIVIGAHIFLLTLLFLRKQLDVYNPLMYVYPVVLPIYFFGFANPGMFIFINFMVLVIGVLTILRGNKENNIRTLNFGLVIITALVICRFFDSDIPFTVRGILFLLLGGGFFYANHRMLSSSR